MSNPIHLTLPTVLAGLSLAACGGTSSNTETPPSLPEGLEVETSALTDGGVWQLNRAIQIQASQAIDFASVNVDSVSLRTIEGGFVVPGTYGPGLNPTTGEDDPTVIRFQPACALEDGGTFGFAPGTEYALTVRGADTLSFPLRSISGEELASTVELEFSTPSGTDPSVLFYDEVAGAPRISFAGQPVVALNDLDTTRIEIGSLNPQTFALRRSAFGIVEVDPSFGSFFLDGLPLNHYVDLDSRVAFVVEFDQSVSLAEDNLARVGVEYLDGTWQGIPSRVTPLAGCGRHGSAVRLELLGTLPPQLPLRLRLDAGFRDLVGEALLGPVSDPLPVVGASELTRAGARVDAIFEGFQFGGEDPGSMEDIVSPLGVPRGRWGGGFIAGEATPDGVSAVRSKWYPVGLAGHDGLGAPQPPTFFFSGTDADGVVLEAGGAVTLGEPVLGPMPLFGTRTFSVDLALANLFEPTGIYAVQPRLLAGDRLRLAPSPIPGQAFLRPIFGATVGLDTVELQLGVGCYAPSVSVDCVPWDLSALFPNPGGTVAEVIPRSFDIYTLIARDFQGVDRRVTITFDAARAGADGEVDEATALSAAGGWATDVTALSGQPWDFLRFEVLFELDASGDGFNPLQPSPVVDFIKVPIDFRR